MACKGRRLIRLTASLRRRACLLGEPIERRLPRQPAGRAGSIKAIPAWAGRDLGNQVALYLDAQGAP
jgi:hypothetical protein